MSTTKKNIKVRDLKPSKDAKGGGVTRNSHDLNTLGRNSHGTEGSTTNTKHHLHGGTHGNK